MRGLRVFGLVFAIFGATGVIIGIGASEFVGPGASVLIGLASGVAIGLVFASGLFLLDRVSNRGFPPGTPHEPRQHATVPVTLSRTCHSASRPRCPRSRPCVANGIARHYAARTIKTSRSYGEDVTVQPTGDPHATTADITSLPILRTTFIGYGEGRRNIATLTAALQG